MTMLFPIAENILSTQNTKKTSSSVIHCLNQVKRNLEEVLEENKEQQNCSKKTKSYAQESILSIKQLERELQDESEEENKQSSKYTEDDTKFIEEVCKAGKSKNWKDIFDMGKAKGLFKSYKSPNTLKSSYYHIQRRKKQ